MNMDEDKRKKPHEIVRFPGGNASVKPVGGREAMHSSIGPWEEAHQVYIAQSGLRERLQSSRAPLIVYDVGLGIAANALAAYETWKKAETDRNLEIVSFEADCTGIEIALGQSGLFPFLERNSKIVSELLESGRVERGKFSWQLLRGDFRDVLKDVGTKLPPAEIIFYDFYSPAENPELWGPECLDLLRQMTDEAVLVTYCTSTSARSAMLMAGFAVGYGNETALKAETTVAFAQFKDLLSSGFRPLGGAWLRKLERSSKPLPDLSNQKKWPTTKSQAIEFIKKLPQFI